MENQFVIVRADRAGVFFGRLVEKTETSVKLADVRKLHYWNGAAAVEEIAMIGTKKQGGCRFTVTVPEMEVNNWIQILPCTEDAVKAINTVREWKA